MFNEVESLFSNQHLNRKENIAKYKSAISFQKDNEISFTFPQHSGTGNYAFPYIEETDYEFCLLNAGLLFRLSMKRVSTEESTLHTWDTKSKVNIGT